VDRSSPTDKIQDFIERGEKLVAKMKYLNKLARNPIVRVRACTAF